MASLSKFKSTIKDIARPNMFVVSIEPPRTLQNFYSLATKNRSLQVYNRKTEHMFTYGGSSVTEGEFLSGLIIELLLGGDFSEYVETGNSWVDRASVYADIRKNFNMVCEAAEFPGRTIATNDDATYGPPVAHAYDVNYNDITLTMICRKDMMERAFFDLWMETIVTNGQPKNMSYIDPVYAPGTVNWYDDTVGTVTIFQMDDQQRAIGTCILNNAFPISLSAMNLSWEEQNTYQRFTVTFSYRYHNVNYDSYPLSI